MGPGLGVGENTKALVRAALTADVQTGEPPRAIVLDADALTSFANDAYGLAVMIRRSGKDVVLTPHDGEFARLFGSVSPDDEGRWAASCQIIKPWSRFWPRCNPIQSSTVRAPPRR